MTVSSAKWSFGELAGVVDLSRGRAVHAIAGDRPCYEPIPACGGDAIALVQKYRELGIRSFYIADLDAISGQSLQAALLDEMAGEADGDVLVDLGWSGTESEAVVDVIAALVESHSHLGVIAASETARSPKSLNRLAEHVASERICLGLDFRRGHFLISDKLKNEMHHPHARSELDGDEEMSKRGMSVNELAPDFGTIPSHWISHAITLEIQRLVILDLASVGKQVGAVTANVCRDIKQTYPNLRIWSGGGIRNPSDANHLIQQGCDRCLIATALHGLL